MNSETLALAIAVRESAYYKNEYLRPFIDAYIAERDSLDNCLFQLFHQYQDESIKQHFIGLRVLKNTLCYFFISMRWDYDHHEVSGFSTYYLDDPRLPKLIDKGLANYKNPIVITETYRRKSQDDIMSLGESIQNAGIETRKYLKI